MIINYNLSLIVIINFKKMIIIVINTTMFMVLSSLIRIKIIVRVQFTRFII